MEESKNSEVFYNVYEVTLLSNCYTHGYKVKVASLDIESAISKAKEHLEQDIDNINIKVDSITKVMKEVLV